MRWALLAAALLAFAGVDAQAETVAVVNGRIVTMGPAGDIDRGTVVVRDGRIVAVGKDVKPPADARIVDARGGFVTPGLVATVTPLGLDDTIGSGYPGRGSTAERLSAGFSIAADVNPDNPQIGEARIEGVTSALVTPNAQGRGKLFGGAAAVVRLGAGMAPVVDPFAAIYLDASQNGAQASGGSRGAILAQLGRALADARAWRRNPAAVDPARLEELSLSRLDMDALAAVVTGEKPLLVEVNRASDIRNLLAFAREQRIRVILSGAAEAWLVAADIARAGVPVVIDAEENQLWTFDTLNATYENAAVLARAGVLVAFKPSVARIVFLIRTPRFLAGRAARYGLSLHDALAAITINPARMFGFAKRSGSIEVGKDADLVVWSGDPLETTTVARTVMIAGREQPMTARNRALRDRYIGTVTR